MAVSKMFCLSLNGKPDSCWSWVVCGFAALSQAMTMGVLFSFGILFPIFMDYFQETREKTAWVGSLGVALVFFFGPLSGSLINRFDCRITTIVGGLICVSSLIVASFSNSITVLFITYSVLYGLGSSFVFASSWIIVSKYFHKRRSLALGLVGGGQGLGVMAQGPLLQFLLDTTDWRGTFRVMAGVVFSICLAALSYAPVEDTNRERVNVVGSSKAKDTKSKNVQGKFSLDFSVCKIPVLVAVAISAGLQHFGRLTPQIHLVKHCATLGISADSAVTLYIFIGMASIIGRISSGFVCDLPSVNSLYVYQAAVFFQGVSTLLLILAKTYVPLAAYAFVFGLCDGALVTTLNICLLTSVDSSRRASVIALLHPVVSVFIASGAPVSGFIADETGSYAPAFLLAGGVIVVAAAVPFVLLFPCLRRDAVRVRDENAAREELHIGELATALTCADYAAFVTNETMHGGEDVIQKYETQTITVEGASNGKSTETPENKCETQADVHNEITRGQKETNNFTGDDDRDKEGERGNAQDIEISGKEDNCESLPEGDNHREVSTLTAAYAVSEGSTNDEDEEADSATKHFNQYAPFAPSGSTPRKESETKGEELTCATETEKGKDRAENDVPPEDKNGMQGAGTSTGHDIYHIDSMADTGRENDSTKQNSVVLTSLLKHRAVSSMSKIHYYKRTKKRAQ